MARSLDIRLVTRGEPGPAPNASATGGRGTLPEWQPNRPLRS
jgi:hypothetical protein